MTEFDPQIKESYYNTITAFQYQFLQAKEKEIREQLFELISRGLLVVEEESHISLNADTGAWRKSQKLRLVCKEQEYIENIEQEIAGLKSKIKEIEDNFMTTFNPEATPQCDLWKVKGYCSAGNDMPEENFVYYADAQIMERRARVAEEKLRIAIITLKDLADPNSLFDSVLFSQSQLEEIERMGK